MKGRLKTDMLGHRIGSWTVMSEAGVKNGSYFWECVCDCGTISILNGCNLRRGSSKSCGCKKAELMSKKSTTHGDTRGGVNTKEFRAWMAIINRCTKPTDNAYHHYGGRGITVCYTWLNSYESFLSDIGRAPTPKHSVERKDNNKGYDKDNCVWATHKEQCRNRRSNVYLTHNGVTKILGDWAKEFGIDRGRIGWHLKNGKSFAWVYNKFKHCIY